MATREGDRRTKFKKLVGWVAPAFVGANWHAFFGYRKARIMSLKFTGVRVDDAANFRIAIQASDASGRVPCYVSYEALQDHVGVGVDPLEAYDTIAAEVRQALRMKDQLRGRADDGSLSVGTADIQI